MTTAAERYNGRLNWDQMHTVDGVPYPTNEKRLQEIKDMEVKPSDIVLVSYPKCGTTWAQEILSYLRDDCDLDKIKKYMWTPLSLVIPGVPMTPFQMVEQMPSPRIIVTHLPFELCPLEVQQGKCKIIYVVRNPKDVAVSYFHFHRKIKQWGNVEDLPWNDFWEVYCEPKTVLSGSWFLHVKNWLPHREKDNVLFITFEELKKNPTKGIRKMASFLGRDISLDRAKGIAELCDFKQMRADAEAKDAVQQGPFKFTIFTRKGEVGDWKNHFTVAQNEIFDKLYKKEMDGVQLDIEFDI